MSLLMKDDGGGEQLERIYKRLETMDAATAEKRATEILFGLGFNKKMQAQKNPRFLWLMGNEDCISARSFHESHHSVA
ncbi:hypothetical protein CCACVL1_24563 [Corchorus capsularis]|uniref:Uncharacterized protein n=1 Tax=Corchorus capsularis TaxID=210143 RepID=A0A1R3GPD0_COCAP|nr:hypothetical protein CCACVL1_24563 [Corchorus capsularis]